VERGERPGLGQKERQGEREEDKKRKEKAVF
jgi:hypothetical protein